MNVQADGPEARVKGEACVVEEPSKNESIRQWYDRTTRRWRKALVWATAAALGAGALLYALASFGFLARLQTYNGAFTIPIAALIWILAFVYIFLVPNREVGFRSQEWIEKMVGITHRVVETRIAPAAEVWQRVGERVEREFPSFLEEAKETLQSLRETGKRLEDIAKKSERFLDEAKPALDSLRKIQGRVELEISAGLFEDMRAATESVKTLSGVPRNATEPDINWALRAIRKPAQNGGKV